MVLKNSTIACLTCLAISVGYNNLLIGEETKNSQTIPELPPEETLPAQQISIVAKEPEVIVENFSGTFDASGFFTNNGFSQGTSRYLNALELSGYLRTRIPWFHNGHLGAYIPDLKRGISNMPPNLNFIANIPNENDEEASKKKNQNNFSANMRLRINPTIHVSEVVRVKGTIDIFDNMVLGSTPSYLSRGMPSPSSPVSVLSRSQMPPMAGINSLTSAISLKRAFAEVAFPMAELRFGRMPYHWGLGILYHSGDGINANYGDQIDGLSLTTRIWDHFITTGYSIAYSGPVVRGGGQFNTADNFASTYLAVEAGQRYPLETGALGHVLMLSILKRDSDFLLKRKLDDGRPVFNYGLFGSYRRQYFDLQNTYDARNFVETAKSLVKRDAHIGLMSLWTSFSYKTFHIEMEAAGILGKYTIGDKGDLLAINDDGSIIDMRDVWLLQGGLALESRYGFLNNRLQVGLNGGLASSQSGPGFGMREGVKNNPAAGDMDGRKLPPTTNYKTNFTFNPAYNIDLLLHKEILGGTSGTIYFKPHISYFFSKNLGIRGDIITTMAPDKSNTPGNSNWLGLEFDANAFFRSDSGFYIQLAYGALMPLQGLKWRKGGDINDNYVKNYSGSNVKWAHTVQAFLGITF